MNMDRVRITVTFDSETYKLLKNISDKNHISISETVRRYTEAGLNGNVSESNINYISAIIREQLRIVMQPSIERLAALSAKTCIQACRGISDRRSHRTLCSCRAAGGCCRSL